jgi:HD-GYP domain-containing protein (c-di-GMP phosphodiesterase class II)
MPIIEPLLLALEYRDKDTRQHCERVMQLSYAMGSVLGLGSDEQQELCCAALFHDIGKIGIPDAILAKQSNFDGHEWDRMRQHPIYGQNILDLAEMHDVALVVRHHHERYDGLGYPDGLSGKMIPLASRIIGVADSYDAMAVTRTYHESKAHSEIMAVLQKEAGGKHDPELVKLFVGIIGFSKWRAAK